MEKRGIQVVVSIETSGTRGLESLRVNGYTTLTLRNRIGGSRRLNRKVRVEVGKEGCQGEGRSTT